MAESTMTPAEAAAVKRALDEGESASYDSRCSHCDTRGADFSYKGWPFCCECMSAFCSWFLDGGLLEAPEMFAYALVDDDVDVAEPEPGTIGAASGTAKCHHCGERIRKAADGWVHLTTEKDECE